MAHGNSTAEVPREAPSRSTLKLEEAWHHFIPREQWDERLHSDMTGVDLGAAPGGWTWQLVNRGMLVTAVDNGPMAESLMDTGLVQHLMADGFTYKPRQPVDWMVCDIVEKPARNAALLETWIGEGHCREAVVNLKLPMKQRYAEVKRLLERIEEGSRPGDSRGHWLQAAVPRSRGSDLPPAPPGAQARPLALSPSPHDRHCATMPASFRSEP